MWLQKQPTIVVLVLHTTTLPEAIHLTLEEGDVAMAMTLHTVSSILPPTIVLCVKSVVKLDTEH